jgi:ParB-like chromosome segregation protein Spo0J
VSRIKSSFDQLILTLPVTSIRPQREILYDHRRSTSYQQIVSSINEIGLIEPLVVFQEAPGEYMLLDGHLRLDALKRMGRTEVECILSDDDEAYTYNRRVNSIPPVAQHLMILKAIANGLTEERIAASLRVDVSAIRRKRNMLDGICDEAVKLLQTRKVSALSFSLLKKMKPARQVESAKHMIASSVNSASFVRALLLATKSDLLVSQPTSQKKVILPESTRTHFAQESETLLKDLKDLEADLGREALTLTVFRGYVRRLLANPRVQRYLEREHKEILNALGGGLSESQTEQNGLP